MPLVAPLSEGGVKTETTSPQKAYEVSQIRLQYPNAYKPWTTEEDSRLIQEYRNGMTPKKLAQIFERKRWAIVSRLTKLLGYDNPAPEELSQSNMRLREAIRVVIQSRLEASLTPKDVTRLLMGLGESQRIQRLNLNKHPYFGRFSNLSRQDIKREIEEMIRTGEIERGSPEGSSKTLKRLRLKTCYSPQQEQVATAIDSSAVKTQLHGNSSDRFSSDKSSHTSAPTVQSTLNFTQDQKSAQDAVFTWWREKSKQVLTLGGYAGTGKTTVIAETIKRLSTRPRIAFCCYTGKASDILREKLIAAEAFKTRDYCGTIHGLIYEKIGEDENDDGKTEILWRKKNSIKADFLVVDEASMVSQEVWKDLCSFGAPILAVGDHGQLPPVGDKYNLMEKPDIRLETIHRQAQESPIVKISLMARLEGRIPLGQYGSTVIKTKDREIVWKIKPLNRAMFLCGRNKTRVDLNAQIRARLGIQSVEPISGDRVICLRNSRRFKVFNGMLGVIDSLKPSGEHWYKTKIKMDSDVLFKGRIAKAQFGQERTLEYEDGQGCLFDWGYALTVHKAQGSETGQVVLFEERFAQMDEDQWRRWLYTGVTRAAHGLIIIGN